ncbi:MAG: SGNH/GDSL hydrolase family protein [Lachnospiraceae bacterium]|nr:SGNH/GDSL hydrolase family protein [Lachnospiraceae bacterium]
MPKQLRMIAAVIAALILITGCTPQPADTTTEESSIQFAPNVPQSTAASTDPSPDMTEDIPTEEDSTKADTIPTEDSSTEPEGSSAESSSDVNESTGEESSSESDPMTDTTAPSSEETTPEETTREVLSFTPVEETVYATDFVNVRDDYSLDANIVTVLGPDNAVTRIGYHEEWSKIIHNGQECYVASAYLTTEAPPPPTTAAPEPTEPVVVIPSYHTEFMNNLSNITFTGRWFTKDYSGYTHYTTLNAGSEISFQISGVDCISVYMSSLHGGDCYFAYCIDGLTPIRQSISQPYIYLGSSGTHTVRIIIDSIGDSGNRWDESVGIGIDGIAFNGGSLSSWKYSNTVIAFYGDSITEGIRTLSSSAHSYISSYTWSCSQALSALPIVCGFPGSGLTTAGTFNTCINAITNLSAGRGAAGFNPSVIVLSHGTNDVGADGATFSAAYNQVLDLLHSTYPNTKIACMIPVSQTHADDIRNCVAGKDWCVTIETNIWNVSYTDNIHPDATSSQNMGYQLSLALRELLN